MQKMPLQRTEGTRNSLDDIAISTKQQPYCRDSSGVIYCGDCLDLMKDWPDGCVDLVLTDPPYGINVMDEKRQLSRGKQCINYGKINWDDIIPPPEVFEQIFRISTNQIIWGGNYFVEYLKNSPCWLIWDKTGRTPTDFADCELAWTSFNTAVRKYNYMWTGYWQEYMGAKKEQRVHPNQKPVIMACWVLEHYSKPEDLILDCYMGSGTFCVAAKKLGRRYIGIDISEEYCQIARDRLRAVDTGVPVKEARAGQRALFE